MEMNIQDEVLLALTVWRENRGGGVSGMQSVANAICNRARKRGESVYQICTAPKQFSSISVQADPESALWPGEEDPQWQIALNFASLASVGELEDITHGATIYYAPAGLAESETKKGKLLVANGTTYKFPDSWNLSAVEYTGTIAHQVFMLEV